MNTDFDLKDLLNKLSEIYEAHKLQLKDKKKYIETEPSDATSIYT